MTTKITKQQAIDLAFAHVWSDPERLVQTVAKEHAIANLGQSLKDLFSYPEMFENRPDLLIASCFSQLMSDVEDDETAGAVDEEYREWLTKAREDVKRVQDKGLPLTLANVTLAFENKAPFEAPTKRKRTHARCGAKR